MFELTLNVNLTAVIIAAVANFLIGMMWYSPAAFGNMWMELAGMKPKNKKQEAEMKAKAAPAMAGSFVLALVMAYVLEQLAGLLGLSTAVSGAQLGFWVWLGFVGAVGLSDHLYSKNPGQLWLINTGYRLVTFLVMGALVAVM